MSKWNKLARWQKLVLIMLVICTYGLALIPIMLYLSLSNSPKKAVAEIVNGLSRELPRFELSWSGNMQALSKLFTEALNQKPELIFIYDGYTPYGRKGSFGGLYDIEIVPEYNPKYMGFDSKSIIKDDGVFDVMKELIERRKQEDLNGNVSSFELLIVSKDHSRIWKDLNDNDAQVYELLEELDKYDGVHFTHAGCHYTALILSFIYKRNAAQIRTMRISHEKEAVRLQNYLFGNKVIPPFMKVWLLFSYIQQNVEYDAAYVRSIKAGMTASPEPETAFGALINKRAISKGTAEAFAVVLNTAGIECLVIKGTVNLPNSEDEYYWNMVKLGNNTYYHVDTVWHIEDRGVNISRFMKSDREFKREHKWSSNYPVSNTDYLFDDIEIYISERKPELWAANIDKYLLEPMVVE